MTMAGMFMATVAASTYSTTSTPVATGCAVYQSVILPTSALNATYIKATTTYVPDTQGGAWFTFDTSKSLIGAWASQQWLSQTSATSNQKLNINLISSNIIKRIYYENGHYIGLNTDVGANSAIFYGTNDVTAFNNTTFSSVTGLTELWTGTFARHVNSDIVDPHYIDLPNNNTSYQYYVFRFPTNHGSPNWMGIRRIELQKCTTTAPDLLVTFKFNTPGESTQEAAMAAFNGCYKFTKTDDTHYVRTEWPQFHLTYNVDVANTWVLRNDTLPLIGYDWCAVYNAGGAVEVNRYSDGFGGYITISKTACDL